MVRTLGAFPPAAGRDGRRPADAWKTGFARAAGSATLRPGAVGGQFPALGSLRAQAPTGRLVQSPHQPSQSAPRHGGRISPSRIGAKHSAGTFGKNDALSPQKPRARGRTTVTETRQCALPSSPSPLFWPSLPAKAPTLSAASSAPASRAAPPQPPAATWQPRPQPAAQPAWSATTSRRSSAATAEPGLTPSRSGAPRALHRDLQRRPEPPLRAAFARADQRPGARETKGQTCSTRS